MLVELEDAKKQSEYVRLRSVGTRILQMQTGLRLLETNQKQKIEENFAAVNNTLAGVVSTITFIITTLRGVHQTSSLLQKIPRNYLHQLLR